MDKIKSMLADKLSMAARATNNAHTHGTVGELDKCMEDMRKAQAAYFHHSKNMSDVEKWKEHGNG